MDRENYPGGPIRDIRRFETIPLMVEASSKNHGSREFMRETDAGGNIRSVTFEELHSLSVAFARNLLTYGESPVVAVCGRNGIDWAAAFLGTLFAGGVVVPIDKELPASDISGILHYSGASVFVFDQTMAESVREHMHSGKAVCAHHLVMNCSGDSSFTRFSSLLESCDSPFSFTVPGPVSSSSTAVISYTSGTMGAAKGVVLSHGNILSDLQMMLASAFIRTDEVFLSVLPFHHMYECVCGFLCPLQHGCRIVISRGLRYIVEDLSANSVSLVLGVPLLWEGMYRRIKGQIESMRGGSLKFALGKTASRLGEFFGASSVRRKVFSAVHDRFGGSLETLVSGGAALDAEVMKGFGELGFRVLQGYGLTECSPIVAVCRYNVLEPGTVGPPLPDVEVRIESPDSEGAGEILVRGPNVMQGYHNDPEATSEVLSEDGWFRTGDFGIMEKGILTVTGRKKNIIVAKNGKNVYPEELEHKLNRSRYISESLIFGREAQAKGEEIWCIIFPDYDALIELAEGKGEKLTEEFGISVIRSELRSVNSRNPSYKRISNFILRETEFPKTTTKKIRRPQVFREAGLTTGKVFSITGGN